MTFARRARPQIFLSRAPAEEFVQASILFTKVPGFFANGRDNFKEIFLELFLTAVEPYDARFQIPRDAGLRCPTDSPRVFLPGKLTLTVNSLRLAPLTAASGRTSCFFPPLSNSPAVPQAVTWNGREEN